MKTKSFFLPGGGIDVAAMQAHKDSMPTGAIGMPRPGSQHPSEILNELVEDSPHSAVEPRFGANFLEREHPGRAHK